MANVDRGPDGLAIASNGNLTSGWPQDGEVEKDVEFGPTGDRRTGTLDTSAWTLKIKEVRLKINEI